MTHGSLFSGMGGFDLAAQWAGIENVFQVEINPFCHEVLKKNFPNVARFGDVKNFSYSVLKSKLRNEGRRNRTIDIISGGFPCQPFSLAGERKGSEDERALFPEMFRIIKEFRPRWIVAENVYGLLSIEHGDYAEKIFAFLEGENYEVQAFIIPATAVNAPHRRDRVWIVAHARCQYGKRAKNEGKFEGAFGEENALEYKRPNRRNKLWSNTDSDDTRIRTPWSGIDRYGEAQIGGGDIQSKPCGQNKIISNSTSARLERTHGTKQAFSKCTGYDRIKRWDKDWYEVATEFCRVDNGLPVKLDGFELSKSKHRAERLKGLGNAIVPEIAFEIFQTIQQVEHISIGKYN